VVTSRAKGTGIAPGGALDERLRDCVRSVVRSIDHDRVSLDSVLSAVRAEWNAAHADI
jgi:hypothetical protein